MQKILTILERKFDSFCKKMGRFLQENLTIFQENRPTFTGKFKGFSRILGQYLHESLAVFTGTFDNFSGNLDDFLQ